MLLLTVSDVVHVHASIFGERVRHGMDRNYPYLVKREALSYAVEMLHAGYLGNDPFDLAAYMAEKIACGHVFLDGNKRTAWTTCALVLRTSGWQVSVKPDCGLSLVLGLVEHRFDYLYMSATLKKGKIIHS